MWTLDDVIEATGGLLEGFRFPGKITGVSTDSRTICEGELFVALQGPTFNGYQFVNMAFEKGAVGAVVPESDAQHKVRFLGSHFFLRTQDPLTALQSLATWHRRQYTLPLVAVTGSNGKTTTKEMIAAILMQRGGILKSEGNLNNHIGVPLSLLRLKEGDGFAVVELGISRMGEMRRLCELAAPTIGVITNIGPAHLEFLGDMEGVAREKTILFDYIQAQGGVAILNQDDLILHPWHSRLFKKWTYGIKQKADVMANEIEEGATDISFTLQIKRNGGESCCIALPVVGKHQVYNLLAAVATACALGFQLDEIRNGISSYRPPKMRGEVMVGRKGTLFLDAYNANPASMRASIETLVRFPSTGDRKIVRRVALLGDMLELGEASQEAHLEIGNFTAKNGVDHLIAVGPWAGEVAEGARRGGIPSCSVYSDIESAERNILNEIKEGDCVLIKGSRGMKMERFLSVLAPMLGVKLE